MFKNYFFILSVLLLTACQNDDVQSYIEVENDLDAALLASVEEASKGQGVRYFILPESTDYGSIPQDPLNPITKAKVELGKMLLHETALGGAPKMNTAQYQYTCVSCHPVASGFHSGVRQGVGEGGLGFGLRGEGRRIDINMPIDSVDIQPIRPPTLLNLAYQDVMLWNGQFGGTGTNANTSSRWTNIPENAEGFQGIEVQAMQGQDTHRLLVDRDFVERFGYKEMFDQAFGDIPEAQRYTRKTGALALAAFNRTILSNKAPWQDWLRGKYTSLTDKEKRGALLFFGKAKCINCHTGPALKDKEFHAFGFGDFDNSPQAVIGSTVDFESVKKGRGGFTRVPQDDYKFKTPTLYNLKGIKFLGHGGTFTSVKEVISYKNNGVPQQTEVPETQLAEEFGTVLLQPEEIEQLTAFIENGLYDPDLERYVPERTHSGYCFPSNDPIAKQDLGCQ